MHQQSTGGSTQAGHPLGVAAYVARACEQIRQGDLEAAVALLGAAIALQRRDGAPARPLACDGGGGREGEPCRGCPAGATER